MFKTIFTMLLSIGLVTSPFSYSVNNLNITGVSFGQYTEYTDIEFTFTGSLDSVDFDGNAVNASHRTNFAANGVNFTCAVWSNTGTAGSNTYESECSRYVMSGSTTVANSAGYFTNASYNTNMDAVSASISSSYDGVRYDVIGYDYLNIHFDDNKAHTGTFQINAVDVSNNYAAYYSDNENVTVIGQNVYFYNVSNFNLKRYFKNTNVSSLNHSYDSVVVANLQETTSESLIDVVKFFMGYTAPERMNALAFWKGYGGYNYYGNSGDYPSILFETFPAKTSYFSASKLTTNSGKLYIAFYHNRGTNSVFNASNIILHYENSNIPQDAITVTNSGSAGNWNYIVLTLTPNTDVYQGSKTFSIEFKGINNYKNLQVVPLYVGNGSDLTQEEKTRFGIVSNPVQTSINNSTNTLNSFNGNASQLHTIEDNAADDFNEAVDNLDFNIPNSSSFTASANFFKRVFTDFVGSTPLFTPIAIALMVSLALLILGAM